MAKKVKIVKSFNAGQHIPKEAKFLDSDVTQDPPVFYYEMIVNVDEQHDDLVPKFVSDQLKNKTNL